MELNIPVSLLSEAGEIVFNVLDGDGTNTASDGNPGSLAGLSNVLAPVGLPDGNGYLITFIGGNDGAPIRNPVTNRPHTHGTIPHRFRRSGKIIAVEGDIVVTHPKYRKALGDNLRTVLNACLQAGVFGQASEDSGRFFWKPHGAETRFHTVYYYDKLTFSGDQAEPKTFAFSLYSEHPEALTYTQDVGSGTSVVVPNDGNTETWPVIKVYASAPFTLTSSATGESIVWGQSFDGDTPPIQGDYIEIDMFRQTMYWDGNQANALKRLVVPDSDFFAIPPGGSTLSCDFTMETLSNDAWVG